MKIDFYQLGDRSLDAVIATLAGKIVESGERLLVVAADEARLAKLDRLLWTEASDGFLAHGVAGGANDSRQPVLLSTSEDAPNGARNFLIADGQWREAALSFDRAFFLFGEENLESARLSWKLLSGRDGVERRYWANEDGKWVQKG